MTTTTITYCASGCTVRSGEGRIRARTDAPSLICRTCEDNLVKWLAEIPDHFALLPTFALPGSAESNPESKSTKAAFVNPPVRLEVIDLLDSRTGRIWNGTAPAHDRRGAIGVLLVHVERLVDERPLTPPTDVTVSSACTLLNRHRLWIAEQDWVTLLLEDLKQLNREVAEAVGIFRRPPVGRCTIMVGDEEPTECGGPLHPTDYGSVRCSRCGETWNPDRLRILGMTLGEPAGEPA